LSNPFGGGGGQTYTELGGGGVNNKVYAVLSFNSGQVYVGGDFTMVGPGIGYTYCAYYDFGSSSWNSVAGNAITGQVAIIQETAYGYLWLGGAFAAVGGSGQNYNTYIEVANPTNYVDTTLPGFVPFTYREGRYIPAFGAIAVVSGGTFHSSTSFQVWGSLGNPGGTGVLSGISAFGTGTYKVVYEGSSSVLSQTTLPHSCAFIGSFIYDGTAYSTYTITTRNVSQQFLADIASTYWSIIGGGVGTFS
jgi:hypothetical protein